MTYTKSQLESLIQGLDKALSFFDAAWLQGDGPTPQWAKDFRASLVEDLTTYRKALAEAEPEPSPYAPSEAYLNALRSFGFTDEDCVEELRQARDSDFELTLADEVRKAYDQGKTEGWSKGYAEGYDVGLDDGYTACADDYEIELVEP